MGLAERLSPGEIAELRNCLSDPPAFYRNDHICQMGAPGGSLSLADIMAVLYFHSMFVDPTNPTWENRDRVILSKAHASPALYAALAIKGFFPVEELYQYCEPGGLEGHTDMRRTPGVDSSGGL